MCGIAGVRKYGDTPINDTELKMLLCSLEHRGNHATGVALLTAGRIHVLKDPRPAWSFVAMPQTTRFFEEHLTDETTIAILHTRLSTIGNPEKNNNNHPIFNGNTAIVHNGGISNHHLLFTSEHLERACETDSDIIRAILDQKGLTEDGITALNKLSGSAAIAAISEEFPDRLLLARSGSPLTYGVTEDKLWWASEMGAIQKAVKPWVNYHGLFARKSRPDIGYFSMPDNTAYLLGGNGDLLRREFKSCLHYNQPNYSGMRESYGSKMRSYRRELAVAQPTRAVPASPIVIQKRIIECPGENCQKKLFISLHEKWANRKCTCGTDLSDFDNTPEKEEVR